MVDPRYISSTPNEVFNYLHTSPNGLSEEEAKKRLKIYGKNVIERKKPPSIFIIFLNQFKSPLIYLLMLAAFISYISGEVLDTYVIVAVIIINSLIGTYHERNAIKSMDALKKIVKGEVKVIRGGKIKVIDASYVVPGDVVIFEEGDKIVADCRVVEESSLFINESTLTGESIGVKKTSIPLKATKVSEMKNILFASTFVIKGKAKAVVISTGNNTLIGKLFRKVEGKEKFPIREKLENLTKNLAKYVIGGVFLVLIASIMLGYEVDYMFELLLAQAVSFIPAGLPIVVTVAIALAAYDMAKKRSVVKKLEAMEAIGRIDFLCIDKTGTVTENKIKLVSLLTSNHYEFKEEGIIVSGKKIYPLDKKDFLEAFEIMVLCNEAKKTEKGYVGDQLDVSIMEAVENSNLIGHFNLLKSVRKLVKDLPFSPEEKLMKKIIKDEENKLYVKLVKGAPEKVVELCSLKVKEKDSIYEKINKFAEKGYRIIGLAFAKAKSLKELEKARLKFVGLLMFQDPVRKNSRETIEKLRRAGIKVMMITGDHKLTAKAVAKEIGLEGKVVEEEELFKLSREQIVKDIEKIAVIARSSIEGKMRVIDILKEKGYRVAMTGDGVNDALALQKADVGISLASATDIAKEASDIILLDNNIENIYEAIVEGRRSIVNIKKTVRYLFSTNFSEVVFLLTFIFSPLTGVKLSYPLTATQILYVNLVTDGLCDVAIATEKTEKELKNHKPSYFRMEYFSKEVRNFIAISAFTSLFGLFFVYFLYFNSEKVGTMVFTTLAFMQLFIALSSRKIYPVKELPNRFLLIAILLSIVVQLLVIYTEPLSSLLKVKPLSLEDWSVVILVSSTLFFAHELAKRFKLTI